MRVFLALISCALFGASAAAAAAAPALWVPPSAAAVPAGAGQANAVEAEAVQTADAEVVDDARGRAQAPVRPRVPGTHVRLFPPAGYVPARGFPGFVHTDGGSALVVNELPGSAQEVIAGFDDTAALQAQGLELIARREVELGPDRAQLFRLEQRLRGDQDSEAPKTEPRWMLVLGDGEVTLTVLCRWGASQAKREGELEAALLSVRWDRSPIDPFEGLGFRLEPAANAPMAARLQLAQRMSDLLVLTANGRLQQQSEGAAFMTFGAVPAPERELADPAERRAFANRLLAAAGELGSLHVKRARALEVDGLLALEQVASAKGMRNDTPLAVYQLVIFDKERCYQGVGVVAAEAQREVFPAFHVWCVGFQRERASTSEPGSEDLAGGSESR